MEKRRFKRRDNLLMLDTATEERILHPDLIICEWFNSSVVKMQVMCGGETMFQGKQAQSSHPSLRSGDQTSWTHRDHGVANGDIKRVFARRILRSRWSATRSGSCPIKSDQCFTSNRTGTDNYVDVDEEVRTRAPSQSQKMHRDDLKI
jgi:hypothetical protein